MFLFPLSTKNRLMWIRWSKVPAERISSKIFLPVFFSPSDAVFDADHEYLLFSLRKIFLLGEKIEILKRTQFLWKVHLFTKYAKIFILPYVLDFETIFSSFGIINWIQNRFQTDSNSKTVLVAALQLTLIWSRRGRFCKPIYFFHVRDKDQYFISFYSSYHGSKSYASFFFSFLSCVEKKRVYWNDRKTGTSFSHKMHILHSNRVKICLYR